jgi:hypothetical protein
MSNDTSMRDRATQFVDLVTIAPHVESRASRVWHRVFGPISAHLAVTLWGTLMTYRWFVSDYRGSDFIIAAFAFALGMAIGGQISNSINALARRTTRRHRITSMTRSLAQGARLDALPGATPRA